MTCGDGTITTRGFLRPATAYKRSMAGMILSGSMGSVRIATAVQNFTASANLAFSSSVTPPPAKSGRRMILDMDEISYDLASFSRLCTDLSASGLPLRGTGCSKRFEHRIHGIRFASSPCSTADGTRSSGPWLSASGRTVVERDSRTHACFSGS